MTRDAVMPGVFVLLLLLGCSRDSSPVAEWPSEASHFGAITHALLLNGGGKPASNYYSHLDHLERLIAHLESTPGPKPRIDVFASDGEDPAPDLATRRGERPPGFWLLPENGIGQRLRPPIVFVNSQIDRVTLRPASKRALGDWFEREGRALGRGDTLLLYVTDHGKPGKRDTRNATITLWGETLSVEELRSLLARLEPEVRVVMLMSQCFSGSFANLIATDREDWLPTGYRCGYFATSADRQASGCYPEISGKQKNGHSHRVFEALSRVSSMPTVEREVSLTDRTPDVPQTTSDFFVEELLARAARREGVALVTFVDRLLVEARDDRASHDDATRLAELAESFGFAVPDTLEQLEEAASALPELSQNLQRFSQRWRLALEALRAENMRLFLEAHHDWPARLEASKLSGLEPERKRETARALLAELVPFSESAPERMARLQELHDKRESAGDARYRVEVRIGVVLRLRAAMLRIAGARYLSTRAPDAEANALAALDRCEDLALGAAPAAATRPAPPPEAFVSLQEERAVLERVSPAWLGIRYERFGPEELAARGLLRGQVEVTEVIEDSPAERAGVAVGDVFLGRAGAPFEEPHALREFIMRSDVGTPIEIRLLRNGVERDASLLLVPYPLVLNDLVGPSERPEKRP